ncbi:MAG: SoxR reducing system RseC family protein [Firmicutes bacterium]|nr:SoxR reducing system RseC family protein [Bacillota bacterium]
MIEQGTVIHTNGKWATVEFERRAACDGCRACGCRADGKTAARLRNTVGAEVGDIVEARMPEKSPAAAAMILYGIPLLLLLAGVLTGMAFLDDKWAIVTGIACMVVSFGVIALIDRLFRRNEKHTAAIVRILGQMTE